MQQKILTTITGLIMGTAEAAGMELTSSVMNKAKGSPYVSLNVGFHSPEGMSENDAGEAVITMFNNINTARQSSGIGVTQFNYQLQEGNGQRNMSFTFKLLEPESTDTTEDSTDSESV